MIFSALQLVPWMYPGDVALTGEGRLYALNMFDARVECVAYADVHLHDGTSTRESLLIFGEARTRCDPILVRSAALRLCRRRERGEQAFVDIDVHLRSRRTTDERRQHLVGIRSFCANPPRYDPFFHNEWITPAAP